MSFLLVHMLSLMLFVCSRNKEQSHPIHQLQQKATHRPRTIFLSSEGKISDSTSPPSNFTFMES